MRPFLFPTFLGRSWTVRNESCRHDDEVLALLGFVLDRTGGLSAKGAIHVRDAGRRSRGNYSGVAGSRKLGHSIPAWVGGRVRYYVRLTLPLDDWADYGVPEVCGHSTEYRRLSGTVGKDERDAIIAAMLASGQTKLGRWPIYQMNDWREVLVSLAAHEAAHLVQYDRERGHSEVWCEEFALQILNEYRAARSCGDEPDASAVNGRQTPFRTPLLGLVTGPATADPSTNRKEPTHRGHHHLPPEGGPQGPVRQPARRGDEGRRQDRQGREGRVRPRRRPPRRRQEAQDARVPQQPLLEGRPRRGPEEGRRRLRRHPRREAGRRRKGVEGDPREPRAHRRRDRDGPGGCVVPCRRRDPGPGTAVGPGSPLFPLAMTTKADAAVQLLGLARDIDRAMAGDEDADGWVLRLLWLVRELDPHFETRYRGRRIGEIYGELLLGNGERESKEQKIRKLALHPGTPGPERDAAIRALAGLQGRRRAL